MPEIDEHDNYLFPDREERKKIMSHGTEEDKQELALGVVLEALRKTQIAESKMDVARFLLPKSRQYVFDETMEKLVRKLWERNWEAPDISVKFHWYGPQQAYSRVDTIRGPDFKLWFCRVQGQITPDWNDAAAVTQLNIPRKELNVFEDFSGPTFHLYVGDNWERNQKWFESSSKVNSKINGEPKRYLVYKGSPYATKEAYRAHCGAYTPGKLQPYLLHTDDLEREYGLQSGDPESFRTEDIFNGFNEFFKGVIARIEK
jgi:hypothetical protein